MKVFFLNSVTHFHVSCTIFVVNVTLTMSATVTCEETDNQRTKIKLQNKLDSQKR